MLSVGAMAKSRKKLGRCRGRVRAHSTRPLTIPKILDWADRFHRQNKTWPRFDSVPIANSAGESWRSVHNALRRGKRGLPAGSSLSKELRRHRGVVLRKEALDENEIFKWAKSHFLRAGAWPTATDGPIPRTN